MTAVVLATAASAAAQEMRPTERSVTTAGQAIVKLSPDRAWVTVGIEARAPKSQEAQKRAAEVMTRIQAQLKALGIPENAIRTVSFNLHADWDHTNNRRVLRGYVVSNLVEVKVDDLAIVADVLDRSIAAGGNSIHGVRWDIQNRDRVERDALRQAVEDAKVRAEVAVAAAGAKLGPVLRISEQRFDHPRPMMDMVTMRSVGAATAAPETPISPGEIEVRASVTVSFSIQ
ncbi:MAG: SIMPL domain-containing protein [Vicinamibacterales bacterium]